MSETIEELKEELREEQETTPKKSKLEDILPSDVIEFARIAPKNPVLRTKIHSIILTPLPDDRDTFIKIRRWIEANITCTKRVYETAIAFRVPISYSYEEYGNAEYRDYYTAAFDYSVSHEDLERALRLCKNLAEFYVFVEGDITSAASEQGGGHERYRQSTDVSNRDASETENHEACITGAVEVERMKRNAVAWLQKYHTQEYDRLRSTT
jgi:hypothetical protein